MNKEIDILFEDNHLIGVNKGNHDLVQKDNTGDLALDDKIRYYIKAKYNKPGAVFLGVIHRLDRPVSGIVLFARTSKALTRMNELFRLGEVQKTYWAIVKNRPEKNEDIRIDFMTRNTKQNKSYCHNEQVKDSKQAELSYRLLTSSDKYHLLEIDLKTGRHHQIRSQLANIGCAVRGDLKYGYPRSNPDGGISLHARQVRFLHPVSKEPVSIIADPPDSDKLWQYFKDSLEGMKAPGTK
jgi:23S rRNA pseudouridine1911/1915/1917 synthase